MTFIIGAAFGFTMSILWILYTAINFDFDSYF